MSPGGWAREEDEGDSLVSQRIASAIDAEKSADSAVNSGEVTDSAVESGQVTDSAVDSDEVVDSGNAMDSDGRKRKREAEGSADVPCHREPKKHAWFRYETS